jgi:hypothetical protein
MQRKECLMPHSSYVIEGKDLERYFFLHEELVKFDCLFTEETSDRALAIVGAAFLDTLLEHILINFLVNDEKEVGRLLQPEQSLGAYGSRTSLLYGLGFIGKIIRDDLRLVGKIRNRFAHHLQASFEEDPLRSWCRSLRWHEISMSMPAPAGATCREIFQVGVNQLICHLNGIVGRARLEKRTTPEYS